MAEKWKKALSSDSVIVVPAPKAPLGLPPNSGSKYREYDLNDGRVIRAVRMPLETYGPCRICFSEAVLGDGLCMICYDERLK